MDKERRGTRKRQLDNKKSFPMTLGSKPLGHDNADKVRADYSDFESTEPQTVRRRLYTQEVKHMWNLVKVIETLGTREKCIEFCEKYGLIPSSKMCSCHRTFMSTRLAGQLCGYFYCGKPSCGGRRIYREINTWFESLKISLPSVFYLMYAFAHSWSYEKTVWEDYTSESVSLSHNTIRDWFNYCREIVVIDYLDQVQCSGMIGGPGKVVQIDESKFGKGKCIKGRRVDSHWVLGMAEEGSQHIRLEVCPDNDRTADALIPLIVRHVAPGSIIHTDGWEAYNSLGNFCVYGYTHKRVNRSDSSNRFVDEDGTHTQKIMSQWRVVKKSFSDRHIPPEQFADWIIEYQWRRYQEKQKNDVFESLLQCVKRAFTIKYESHPIK